MTGRPHRTPTSPPHAHNLKDKDHDDTSCDDTVAGARPLLAQTSRSQINLKPRTGATSNHSYQSNGDASSEPSPLSSQCPQFQEVSNAGGNNTGNFGSTSSISVPAERKGPLECEAEEAIAEAKERLAATVTSTTMFHDEYESNKYGNDDDNDSYSSEHKDNWEENESRHSDQKEQDDAARGQGRGSFLIRPVFPLIPENPEKEPELFRGYLQRQNANEHGSSTLGPLVSQLRQINVPEEKTRTYSRPESRETASAMTVDSSFLPQSISGSRPPKTMALGNSLMSVKEAEVEDVEAAATAHQIGIPGNGKDNDESRSPIRRTLAWFRHQYHLVFDLHNDAHGWKSFTFGDYAKKTLVLYVIVLSVAAGLYYGSNGGIIAGNTGATYSWWLIFLGVRQNICLLIAKYIELVLIDMITIRTSFIIRMFGPYVALFLISSRGLCAGLVLWVAVDFAMLYGGTPFSNHWLYYQEPIHLFNANNPSGSITSSNLYARILGSFLVFGFVMALKRTILAAYLGKRTAQNYRDNAAATIKSMIVLAKVARLAEEIKFQTYDPAQDLSDRDRLLLKQRASGDSPPPSPRSADRYVNGQSAARFKLDSQQRKSINMMQDNKGKEKRQLSYLDLWDDIFAIETQLEEVSIYDVLEFRQVTLNLDTKYPFSAAFGKASTRDECIQSAQRVYDRLSKGCLNSDALPFETLALIAVNSKTTQGLLSKDGSLNRTVLKTLVRLFRPKDGNVDRKAFVRACDEIYISLATLRANIANSSQIDRVFEQIATAVVGFILFFIILAILQIDPLELFLAFSTIILSFSFMFGGAASNAFEGMLFVLVRQPFDIGDRVHMSNPQIDTNIDGSVCWIVENVTLFTTTARNAATREMATFNNGHLSSSRIINANRSPAAQVFINLKFHIDTPHDKLQLFESVLRKFVADRPDDWLALHGFRVTRVEAEQGLVEYVIILQHREKWQNIGPILTAKAEVASYCREVQKKLGLKYYPPALPVNLDMRRKSENDGFSEDMESVFVTAAEKKTM